MDILDCLIQHLSNLGLHRLAELLMNLRQHFFPPPPDLQLRADLQLRDPTPVIVDVHEEEDWEPIEMIRKDCEISRPSSTTTYIMV